MMVARKCPPTILCGIPTEMKLILWSQVSGAMSKMGTASGGRSLYRPNALVAFWANSFHHRCYLGMKQMDSFVVRSTRQ